ncbi:MAG: diguanylate cyclase [Bryobacteraceae bacterium]|nr:diguanylate cyclase [Bryobacteraceae bacterium]
MSKLNTKARIVIGGVVTAGWLAAFVALVQWGPADWFKFAGCLAAAIVTSKLKVRLAGVPGSLSVNFIFILLAIVTLPMPQAVFVGIAANLAQSLWGTDKRPEPVQLFFNVGSGTFCTYVSSSIFHSPLLGGPATGLPALLFATTLFYFLANTILVAAVIAATQAQPVLRVWYRNFFLTGPQYLFGAALTGLIIACYQQFGWQYLLLILPGIHLLYRSYHVYLSRLEEEKQQVTKVASLHLRTIEALALAIEAKDDKAHAQLRRVQTYALAIAQEMNLPADEIQALETASILHDIGKLAVPEYIINKPGRLTKEEFEKMKVHPVVGAKILECVQFPYPVVPIVRSHHERWDGAGYPDNLKGRDIPVGARILAAVDCLDALVSDRQYRKALPIEEAVKHLVEQSGKAFDPAVVEILARRYREFEEKARLCPPISGRVPSRATSNSAILPAAAPSPSERREVISSIERIDFITSIASARQEFQTLHEVTRDLGTSLSPQGTASLLAQRLVSLVPYDTVAFYLLDTGKLKPLFVHGQDAGLFRSLEIPIGEGLAGWVAQNRRPIVNGNPSVEVGYLADERRFSFLRSALVVPLETPNGVLGVMALYRRDTEGFTKDHLRVLLAINSKAAMTIENAMRHRSAERKAGTDPLTGLANAQGLFLGLERRLDLAREADKSLAVLVLDLDGFKQVNDRFGHLTGNRVLKDVGRGLEQFCRDTDLVARMGGDEFVMVLPELPRAAVEDRIRVIRAMVEAAGIHHTGEDILSASIGLAEFPADGHDGETILDAADKRMYRQKRDRHARVLTAPTRA